MTWKFERSAYRIPYPPTARGTLTVDKRELPLVDCSERGLRYIAESHTVPESGSRVAGVVTLLSTHDQFPVEGTVIRCRSCEIALVLDVPGIPMQAIYAEQRFLARRFPARFDPVARR